MAKRMLSNEQRVSLRKEIKARLSKKEKSAVIIKAISESYGIAPITARWYLNGVKDTRPGRKPGKKSRAKRRTSKRKVRRRRKTKATRRAGSNGRRSDSTGSLQAAIQKTAQRARKAKKLYSKWKAALGHAREIRSLEARTRKSAIAAEALAKKLGKRIRKLTAR